LKNNLSYRRIIFFDNNHLTKLEPSYYNITEVIKLWFSIDFNSHTPVYQQIKDKIKENIITENIKEDEFLPSIRNLAKDLGVNLNTVSRAYRELVSEEVLKVERGRGYKPKNVDEDLFFKEKIEKFKKSVEMCKSSGIKKSKLSSILENIYKNEEK